MAKGANREPTSEQARLDLNKTDMSQPWYEWGTYVSERQWGTVREDYSADGSAWDYFSHDVARSRAYRWGEDGLFGWCDRHCTFALTLALWNGKDPILKERIFGLTNSEGNHGEDVKELYFFTDGLPSGAYMKGVYKYPVNEYPYEDLLNENKCRTKLDPEYELLDTDALANGYFDIQIEYAKLDAKRVAMRLTVTNCSNEAQQLSLLPQACFRNTWDWKANSPHPVMSVEPLGRIHCPMPWGEDYWLSFETGAQILFTENSSNTEILFGNPNSQPFVKDAFHRYVVNQELGAINPAQRGTKVGGLYRLNLEPGATQVVHLLLSNKESDRLDAAAIDKMVEQRIGEANHFYEAVSPNLPPDIALIQRQAFAGLIWSKQFYHYDVTTWLQGDPLQPPPPSTRLLGRNNRWEHVHSADVLSMPDSWEYPWFAAWDLAFHAVTFALIDPTFAKAQIILLEREWMMHPNGQIPAYEWAFGDVNPPVHAWAAWRIYQIERNQLGGKGDIKFLERTFHKLLLNFTWWVNRKDINGHNVFEGGFMGLDNIGMFDRNQILEGGASLEQSDATSWMAMFCLNMLTIALELATFDDAYEDIASKFFEHFIYIAQAMSEMGHEGFDLWDEEDGFFYDVLHMKDGTRQYLKSRSAVGLIPLFAITTLDRSMLERFPGFRHRMEWFLDNKPDMTENVASLTNSGQDERRLLSIVDKDKLTKILNKMLDQNEFYSDFGIRSLSKYHKDHPITMKMGEVDYTLDYEPGESTTGAFGGNSNWRGPIWMPINYLLIEALQQFDYYFGAEMSVELPTRSGEYVELNVVAADIEKRLLSLFTFDENGQRPVHGGRPQYDAEGPWKDLVLFNEYFHGDSGHGLGATHQTGWTALIAKIINQLYVTAYADLV